MKIDVTDVVEVCQ